MNYLFTNDLQEITFDDTVKLIKTKNTNNSEWIEDEDSDEDYYIENIIKKSDHTDQTDKTDKTDKTEHAEQTIDINKYTNLLELLTEEEYISFSEFTINNTVVKLKKIKAREFIIFNNVENIDQVKIMGAIINKDIIFI